MTASILLDWTFGHAVGASGQEFETFLAMRERVRLATYRGRGLADALRSMEPVGRWGRLYSVQDLCAITCNRDLSTEAAICKEMLLALVAAEDLELRTRLQDAIRDAAANSDAHEVFRSLESAAGRWLRIEDPSLFSTRYDHSDIEVFGAPMVVLALSMAVAQREDHAPRPGGDVARLATAALSGVYGRLPFNLAIEWAIASPALLDKQVVTEAARTAARSRLLAAPDLISSLVRWTFLGPGSDHGRRGLFAALERELVCLEAFRDCFGVPARAEFAVVSWQNALITLMLDTDLDAAVAAIARFWTPRIHKPELHAQVTVPMAAAPEDLVALLHKLCIPPYGSTTIQLDIRTNPDADLAEAWPVLSPWLAEKSFERHKPDHRMRWLCGLAIDVRVLESRPFRDDSAPFAIHLLSSLSALHRYEFFTPKGDSSGRDQDATPAGHLGWLSQRAWASGQDALGGEGATNLGTLLPVLEEACAPGFIPTGVDPDAVTDKLSDVQERVTTGALYLVEDAIAASTTSAQSPWLNEAETVVALYARQMSGKLDGAALPVADELQPASGEKKGPSRDSILYGLLRRYLTPDSPTPLFLDERILAEVGAKDDEADAWDVNGRRLLLAPSTEAAMWIGPGDRPGEPALNIRLARALMRVTAAHEDTGFSPEIAETWREDLDRTLRELTTPIPFDRFARLKLLRMIADGVFDGHDRLLILVLTALLIYGGPFHVQAVEDVFSGDSRAATRDVRTAIYLALTRRRLAERFRDQENRVSEKERMLDQLRAICLFTDDESRDYILGKALDLERQSKREGLRAASADMDSRRAGSYETRTIDDPVHWIAAATANMVAVDATSSSALIVHRPRPRESVVNAFSQRSVQGPGRHLGVVERVRPGPRLDIRVSPEKTVVALDASMPPKHIGDLVLVDGADLTSDRALQDVGAAGRVTALQEGGDAPDLAQVSILLDKGGVARARVGLGTRQLDWLRDTFNFAGLYLDQGGGYAVRVRQADEEDGGIEPQPGDFADLLIAYHRLETGATLALSVHEALFGEAGELIALILEARPYERFRIWPGQSLTADARKRLADELGRLLDNGFDPRGLLVSLLIPNGSTRPVLALAGGPVIDPIRPFPDLESPFDHRNLAWRDRFSGRAAALRVGEAATLQRTVLGRKDTRHSYFASMPAPPGLPERLRVVLEDSCNEPEAFFDLEPETWKPYDATVEGVIQREASLILPDDPTARAQVIRSFGTLSTGAVITVRTISHTLRGDGRVYASTDVNLPILVNAETISLRLPLDTKQNWRGPRPAKLEHFSWRRNFFEARLDRANLPDAAVANGKATGIFTRVPPIGADPVPCGVAWLDVDGEGVVETTPVLTFTRMGARLQQGSRIEVTLNGDEADAIVFEPFGIADAIWRQDDQVDRNGDAPTGTFVGAVQHVGSSWHVYETGPGRFVLEPGGAEPLGARDALRRVFGLSGGDDDIAADELTRDQPRDKIWSSHGRRCALKQRSDDHVVGTTSADVINGPVRLSGLQLSLESAPGADRWLFVRRLQVLKDRHRAAPQKGPLRPTPGEADDGSTPIAVGDEVKGRFEPRASTLLLSGDIRRRHPQGVYISTAAIQRAPLMPGVYYPTRTATAKILSVDPLVGSFTAVNESSVEDLALELEKARLDETLGIDASVLSLIFVGREDGPDGSPEADSRFLFEWGYGRWVGIEGHKVHYLGGPIQNARFVLAYGDRISAARVVDGVLSIENIAQSRAHLLYEQSLNHQVVNLLRVVRGRDGEPVVDAIMGFEPDLERQTEGAGLPHAQLDPEGVELVRQRLIDESPQRVLARLDTGSFEASSGKNLLFNHRRLDLLDQQRGLGSGDRVFVSAGRIVRLRNDVGLVIQNPGLHPDDVHASFEPGEEGRVLILRRVFSIRQQALGDLLELKHAHALENDKLLVSLDTRRCSLIDGSLPRNPEVIYQRLRRGEAVVGVFGGPVPGGAAWTFELSPGVFVNLPRERLVRTERYYRGDVVVMEATDNDRVSLTLASPSDLRFVYEGRPAVILPRDSHARPENLSADTGGGSRRLVAQPFSVGDLPDLNVRGRNRRPGGKTGQMTDDDLTTFMCRPHPKLGELHLDNPANPELGVHFTPGINGATIVGRIVCGKRDGVGGPRVHVVELGEKKAEHPSDWHLLSYADVPATKLVWPVNKGERQFHDRNTVIWKHGGKGHLQGVSVDLPRMTAGTGPLFFSTKDGVVSMRRPAQALASLVSGPSALLPLLSATEGERTRAVQVTVAHAAADHLLVEHYPGQFLQLFAAMLQFAIAGRHISLQTLDFDLFGSGDRLTLTADPSGDALTLAKLNVTWAHGPRNAFGPGGALLELDVGASDPAEGVAVYGAAGLKIEVPTQDVGGMPARAIIGGERHLSPAPENLRDLRGRTVLLVEEAEGRIGVHGLLNATFAPALDWPWQDDSLFNGAVKDNGGNLTFNREALLSRIRVAGGALAFTVERFGQPTFLALSRRHQEVNPNGDRIVRATVEGFDSPAHQLQLKIGGRHFGLAPSALLRGVGPADEPAVFSALARARRPVWLKGLGQEFVSGYRTEDTGLFSVAPREVVGREQKFLGVVCEGLSDGRLYWLPADEASTFDYSTAEAQQIFAAAEMRRLKVIVLPGGAVSIVRHPTAVAELARLRLGASIFVDRIDASLEPPDWAGPHMKSEWMMRVCVSKQTSVTFAVVAEASQFQRRSFQAEVAVRQVGARELRVLLTAASKRLVVSEAPSWLFAEASVPWMGEAPPFLAPSPSIERLQDVVGALGESSTLAIGVDPVPMAHAYIRAQQAGLLSGIALCVATGLRDASGKGAVREVRVQLLRNLFRRAIRSIPLEPLATWAVLPPGEVSPFTTARRKQALGLFCGGQLDDARRAMERWLDAIDLEGVPPEEEALANAFSLLVGRSGNVEVLLREARFLSEVVSAVRPIGISTDKPEDVLPESLKDATDRLAEVGRRLTDRGLDVPLLPALQI